MRRKMSYGRCKEPVWMAKRAFSSPRPTSKPERGKGRQLLFRRIFAVTHPDCCLAPIMFWISKQSFSMQPWLTWNSLCRLEQTIWPRFLHWLLSPPWHPVFTNWPKLSFYFWAKTFADAWDQTSCCPSTQWRRAFTSVFPACCPHVPNISQALSGLAERPPDHGYVVTTRHVDCEHPKCAADTLKCIHALIHIKPVSFSILVAHGDNAILAWSEKEGS